MKKVVLDRHEWLPILMVGANSFAQSSFTDTGEVHREALGDFARGMKKSVKSLDPFKAFPRPETKPTRREAGLLTAEWIEYEIRSPGKSSRTIRRQVFDLLGPAARAEKNLPEPAIGKDQGLERGLNLLGETEFLLLPCQLSPDFVEDLVTTRRLANRKVWPELLRKGERATTKELRDLLAKFVPLPGHLHNLALIRSIWSNVAPEVFLDRPNILTHHVHLHESYSSAPWILSRMKWLFDPAPAPTRF